MNAPLKGLKVVELARSLTGPWIGQTLADLGADVVKVESPRGDETRGWGPPFIEHEGERTAAYFHACNRGKRAVVADFGTEEGQALVKGLAAQADILIENFKVRGLERYGLDYHSVRKINPRLVYCSVTGFGQDGPYADRTAYEYTLEGLSGMMDVAGDPAGPPQKMGVAFGSIITGLYGVIAIQAALRQREATGHGQHIDLALLDCMTAVLTNQAMNYFATGATPSRTGNAHPNVAPYEVYSVSDGQVIIACGNDEQFVNLVNLLGKTDLAADPRFHRNEDRVVNRASLNEIIGPALAAWKRDDLIAALAAAGVSAGPIHTVAEAFADPQVVHRGIRIESDGVPGLRTPLTFSDASLALGRPAPRLGEHTEEVMAELGIERPEPEGEGDETEAES
ncbi:CaiB/BaiF CoA transferase family protein [Consotaella salsifontis]|uniref:Crotonobetainyl-CoA:carnitine CoA-transferase CaiB n=1 Tax=Consotaella salsifontis TaxID=1365950 RepID=A0A1T4PX34_9HYPH|nr:CaiB/BaiF CoA-transferase family protein [Consotaella salsifontis]SJZ96053.1 Crotonobetainyl-CoA:carnitine CoA-transferase CaiB [Consotaella salsifontis]